MKPIWQFFFVKLHTESKWSLSCLVFSERTYSSQHWPFETDRTVWYCMTFISLLDEKNIYFCFASKWTTFSNIIFYTNLHTTWLLVPPLFSDGHSGLLLLLLKLKKTNKSGGVERATRFLDISVDLPMSIHPYIVSEGDNPWQRALIRYLFMALQSEDLICRWDSGVSSLRGVEWIGRVSGRDSVCIAKD